MLCVIEMFITLGKIKTWQWNVKEGESVTVSSGQEKQKCLAFFAQIKTVPLKWVMSLTKMFLSQSNFLECISWFLSDEIISPDKVGKNTLYSPVSNCRVRLVVLVFIWLFWFGLVWFGLFVPWFFVLELLKKF